MRSTNLSFLLFLFLVSFSKAHTSPSDPKAEHPHSNAAFAFSYVFLPITFLILLPVTFVVAYCIAQKKKLVKRRIVHLCESGAKAPASRMYNYGLVTCGCLFAWMTVQQFLAVLAFAQIKMGGVSVILYIFNGICLLTGCFTGLFMALVAIFDMSVYTVHMTMTGLFIGSGLFYIIFFTFTSFYLAYSATLWCIWRAVWAGLCWLFTVTTIVFMVQYNSARKKHHNAKQRVKPAEPDALHSNDVELASQAEQGQPAEVDRLHARVGSKSYTAWAIFQYLSVLAIELYMISFVPDFMRMKLTLSL